MAAGYKAALDLGGNKADIVFTNIAVPTAGMEVNIDSTKFTTPQQVRDGLLKIAEAIQQGGITNAYPPA